MPQILGDFAHPADFSKIKFSNWSIDEKASLEAIEKMKNRYK